MSSDLKRTTLSLRERTMVDYLPATATDTLSTQHRLNSERTAESPETSHYLVC